MAIRRPDTPLAATVFGSGGDPKLDLKRKQDSIVAVRKAQNAEKKSKSDAFWNNEKNKFAEKAKSKGMTTEQYSKSLDKQKKKADVPSSVPDYSQKGGRNPCPGSVCKK